MLAGRNLTMIGKSLSLVMFVASVLTGGEPPGPAQYIEAAEASYRANEPRKAMEWATKAVEADRSNPRGWNYRGALRFRLGEVKASITDFDEAIALRPESEPYHWQRGISYYYAGEYEKGAKQFELHRTVNPDDVENAVWHFLCVTRWKGIDEARKRWIPIEGDPRVPMMQVHALFAGKATPEDVLKAAGAGDPTPQELRQRLFYAHLYLGLYHEATGDAQRSAEHIRLAVEKYPDGGYMGDVARVHQKLRAGKSD